MNHKQKKHGQCTHAAPMSLCISINYELFIWIRLINVTSSFRMLVAGCLFLNIAFSFFLPSLFLAPRLWKIWRFEDHSNVSQSVAYIIFRFCFEIFLACCSSNVGSRVLHSNIRVALVFEDIYTLDQFMNW